MASNPFIAATAVALAIAAGRPALAQEPAPDAKDAASQFAQIRADYKKAQDEFQALYEKTPAAERQQLFADRYPKGEPYVARVVALATKWPADPACAETLVWVLGYAQGAAMDSVLDRLLADHLQSEQLAAACRRLAYSSSPKLEGFLRAVVTRSPVEAAKGHACFALARVLERRAGAARRLREGADQDYVAGLVEDHGQAWVDELRKVDPEALQREAEQLLEEVVASYAQLGAGRKTLGESAKGELFELRYLAVGKPAPEIEGDDVDGVHFKLSDYRGKVLFLDFWGFW